MPLDFTRLVKKCDVFGIKPQLYVSNASKHKSLLGGFLSMLLILGFLAFAIYTLLSIDEFNFSSIKSWEEFENMNDSLEMNDKNFLLMYRLNHPEGRNMISVKAVKYFINSSNASSAVTTEFQFKDCLQSQIDAFSKDYQPILNGHTLKCLDLANDKIELRGQEEKEGFRSFYLSVNVCEGSSSCANSSEVEEYFKSSDMLLEIWFTNYNFKPERYEIVKSTRFDMLSYVINPKDMYFHEENVLFHKSIVNKDYKFPYSLLSFESYSTFFFKQETRKFMHLKKENMKDVLRINFKKSMWNTIFIKIVGDVSAILSYLGGLWNPLFLVAFLCGRKFNEYSYRLRMANEIYTFPKHKKMNFKRSIHVKTSCSNPTKEISLQSEQEINSNPNGGEVNILPMVEKVLKNQQRIHFSMSDVCCCLKRKRRKRKLIHKAMKAVKTDLDLTNILNKIQEIEKLKHLLLNKDQLFLFNFAPKPRITDLIKKEGWLSKWKNRYELMMFNETPVDNKTIESKKKVKWKNKDFMHEIVRYQKLLEVYSQMKKELHANYSVKTARLLNLLGEELKMLLDPFNNIKVWSKEIITKEHIVNAMIPVKKNISKRQLVLGAFFKLNPPASGIRSYKDEKEEEIPEVEGIQSVRLFMENTNEVHSD